MTQTRLAARIAAFLLGSCASTGLFADEAPDDRDIAHFSPYSILGRAGSRADVPGSAYFVGPERLETFSYDDPMRVLREVPGIYIQEEDGYGLRPNIGIRGSGLDRSSRIALLEDNVLIAPAPYSAPAAYYFPTQRRMKAVEVLKGPSAIKLGPRTTGGAINYRSTGIPGSRAAQLELFAGENGYRELYGYYGDRSDRLGWLFETVQQETNGFKSIDGNPRNGDTGFDIEDYVAKFSINSDPASSIYQSLELKLGHTNQVSNETYLGLTDTDFEADPNRRYAASQLDKFKSDHDQYQLSYTIAPAGANWEATVTTYKNEFDRNWFKLQSVNGESLSSILDDPMMFAQEFAWITGTDSPADAFTLRNNNREYESKGIQAEINADYHVGSTALGMTFGLRNHEDEENRYQDQDGYQMLNERLELSTDNAPGTQSNRVSDADVLSAYVTAEIETGKWVFSPGLRWEDMDMTRKDYDTLNPDRSMGPALVRDSDLTTTIAGLGVLYRLNADWRLLAGIHEGYNPPAPGSDSDEEESLNWELGTRFDNGALAAELIGFYTKYDNLVGTVTASTGGTGMIGDQFDGGEATVQGIEFLSSYTFNSVGGSNIDIPLGISWTYTDKFKFLNGFDSDFDPWGDVMAGDDLPYMPEHQGQISAGLVAERWSVNTTASFVDETRTRAGSGSIPTNQGTDDYWVIDLSASYRVNRHLDLFLRVDNLFDEEYIVARRPAGARPGKERTALFGLKISL